MKFLLFVALLAIGRPAFGASNVDWPVYFGDAAGSHYSQLDQINHGNVARLVPAWTFHTGGVAKNSQIQCNPLIVGGVLYGTSPQLELFALDAATGRELWRFNPFAGETTAGSRGVNRGLVFWLEGSEQRILYTAGHYLHAINPATGRVMEDFGTKGRVDLLQGLDREATGMFMVCTSPGAVYKDVFIVSTRVGEGPGPAAPGHIRAYDVRTGARRWIFHTIPHPGESGHETWPADAWKTAGATNNWAGLVIDQQRGLAFIPTGSPSFDFWGGNRAGANLYADCLLALDALTGERKWHFQFTHHDVWDRDPPAAPVLCTVTRDGKKIDAVAQITKSGHVWVFNRDTGESLFPWEEVAAPASQLIGEITSPTQPLPAKPAAFARQLFTEAEVTDRTPAAHDAVLARLRSVNPHVRFGPPSERGTVILPGFDGGGEWGGAAVDPDGILYVNGNEMAWIHQMVPIAANAKSRGSAVYLQLCSGCHGPEKTGNAAANIPSLVGLGTRLDATGVATLLKSGRGVMPAFGFLPDADRNALVHYLLGTAPAVEEESAGRKIEPTGGTPAADIPYTTTGYNRFLDPDGYPALRPPWGTLNAIDLNTGDYLWRKPLGSYPELTAQGIPPTGTENYGGPLVTAGNLLFIAATKDEKIRAFDKTTGEILWEAQLPAGGFATPATYAVNGRQFVVIACGGGKMGAKSHDAYVAFALPESTQ